jgi:hypothetical protein
MPHHVVVDGSNLATEGRAMPSLSQLNDAVLAYIEDHPDALITVVVDATFGHRIDHKEVKEFDDAVANNEIVAPPAGAVGRGDAFVLSIANKVNATILTNDSYQEFHGQYAWLFDEGRIVGGKPVPHIGWVFVNRTPVRGPLSRKSMQDSKRKGAGRGAKDEVGVARVGSPEASRPMPVPTAPPPGAQLRPKGRGGRPERAPAADVSAPSASTESTSLAKSAGVNELLPFLTFVEMHPPGSSVSAIVESYSSHGAYVSVGDVKGYVPLRLMADPAPRSAREFMKIGESVTLVVDSFAAARRSIDLAVPGLGTAPLLEVAPVAVVTPAPVKRVTKKAAVVAEAQAAAEAEAAAMLEPVATPAKRARRVSKKAAPRAAAAEPRPSAEIVAAPEPEGAERAKPTKRTRAKVAAPAAAVAPVEHPAAVAEPAGPAVKKGARSRGVAKPRATAAAAAVPAPEPEVTAAPPAPAKPKRTSRKSAAAKDPEPEPPVSAAARARRRRTPTT